MTRHVALLLPMFAVMLPGQIDWAAVKAEPLPERRYWRALEYSAERITLARKSYQEGKIDDFHKSLKELPLGVHLCNDTLRATGKNPSKNPKHFKRAELKMREILRRLDGLHNEAGVDDRGSVDEARKEVQKVHEELLLDIMGRRK